jgi:hypothetical protein
MSTFKKAHRASDGRCARCGHTIPVGSARTVREAVSESENEYGQSFSEVFRYHATDAECAEAKAKGAKKLQARLPRCPVSLTIPDILSLIAEHHTVTSGWPNEATPDPASFQGHALSWAQMNASSETSTPGHDLRAS